MQPELAGLLVSFYVRRLGTGELRNDNRQVELLKGAVHVRKRWMRAAQGAKTSKDA